MKKHLHGVDVMFALWVAFFLSFPKALGMKALSWLEVARWGVEMAFLFALLVVLFILISYLRKGRSVFGRARSNYFSWPRTLTISFLLSAAVVGFYWIYTPGPISALQAGVLAVGFLLGVGLLMLYFYSLVRR